MNRIIAALALVCLSPGLAPGQGLQILDFRPAYGPLGPTRELTKTPKFVQGDLLYIDYSIDGLGVDAKTGKVSYDTKLEFFDATGKKRLFERKTPNETVPQLGGKRMPATLFVTIGDALAPGRYQIKLTVKDKIASKEIVKEFPLEVVPPSLAFIHVEALAVGLLGGDPVGVRCLVTGFALDGKKECNVNVTIRILDANGKEVAKPQLTNFPEQLREGADKTNLKILPVFYPVTPNRPGLFYFELTAVDKNAKNSKNAKVELKLPVHVIDVGSVSGGK